MKIGWQRILSMAFLITALVLFAAFHFLPLTRYDKDSGWELWKGMVQVALSPSSLREWQTGLAVSSFVTFSLLIVASPFLGNVWVKSLLGWSVVVVSSGMAAAGFPVIFEGDWDDLGVGGWCLIISPVLNFVGLLLARPQWLKKSGLPFPPESHSAS